jgi:hypothetical protein
MWDLRQYSAIIRTRLCLPYAQQEQPSAGLGFCAALMLLSVTPQASGKSIVLRKKEEIRVVISSCMDVIAFICASDVTDYCSSGPVLVTRHANAPSSGTVARP